jgi:hypothetical protein
MPLKPEFRRAPDKIDFFVLMTCDGLSWNGYDKFYAFIQVMLSTREGE